MFVNQLHRRKWANNSAKENLFRISIFYANLLKEVSQSFYSPVFMSVSKVYVCLLYLWCNLTHWTDTIAPHKFVMLHYTQSQIWTAVACLTLLRDSTNPWAQADILRLWRVYNMMLQYKVQVYSVTNTIFEPNRDGKLAAHVQYEFDIPRLKSL